jgi:hypothetical protein
LDALGPARQLLEAENGRGLGTDQRLLQPLIAELEPAAQACFTEGLEDSARMYYFDGYEATIKQVGMTEVGEEALESLSRV